MLGSMGSERAPALGLSLEVGDRGEFVGAGQVGDRMTDTQVAGGERIRVTAGSHGDHVGGPRANARERQEVGAESFRVRIVKIEVTIDHGLRHGGDRRRSSARHPGLGIVAEANERERVGELMRESERRGGERNAVALRQPGGDGGRTHDADLLSHDHPNDRLESIPSTNHPKTRPGGNQRRQQWIGGQVCVGGFDVIVETKEAPHPSHLIHDGLEGREMGGEAKMIALAVVGGSEIKLDNPGVTTDRHGSAIGRGAIVVEVEELHTCGDAGREV